MYVAFELLHHDCVSDDLRIFDQHSWSIIFPLLPSRSNLHGRRSSGLWFDGILLASSCQVLSQRRWRLGRSDCNSETPWLVDVEHIAGRRRACSDSFLQRIGLAPRPLRNELRPSVIEFAHSPSRSIPKEAIPNKRPQKSAPKKHLDELVH